MMFFLSKLLTPFITPPGLFICLLLLAWLCLLFKKTKPAQFLIVITLIFMYLMSTEVMRDALLLPLENAQPAFKPPSPATPATEPLADYIVVLGGGLVDHSPEEGGKASLADDSFKRTVYAFSLYRQLHIPLVVSGGRVLRGNEVEAEAGVAARLLMSLGVPSRDIYIEDQSRNTWENAANVKALYKPRRVLLVTSAYHMPRSLFCFSRNGMLAIPAPADYTVSRSGYIITSFLPGMGAFKDSFTALKEYIGLIYYWFILPKPPVTAPVNSAVPPTPAPGSPAATTGVILPVPPAGSPAPAAAPAKI